MKTRWVVLGLLLAGTAVAKPCAAMSPEALEKEEAAVLEIPGLVALAGPGDVLPKEMSVQSYSLNASREVQNSTVTKNVILQDLSITRTSDQWTPLLLKAALEGTHFALARLEVRHPASSVRVEMKDVVITSISSSDSIPSNGSDAYLNVSYSFQAASVTQTKGKYKGSANVKNRS